MLSPTKKEWIAIVVVIVVVFIFLGSKFISRKVDMPVNDQIGVTDQLKVQQLSTSTNTTTNNMNPKNESGATKTTADGLVIKEVAVGTGAEAKNGNLVDVQYTGRFADGKVFDSSIPRGQPISFTLGAGMVIKGWEEGILGMKVGGKRSLVIPASLGYGANGYPPVIPPNATLYFDVELVGVRAQ